ncbi:MAG TPA: glutathione S-transferase family protein [Rhizomicrobium sp.]|nr:glutathione S-transferase family protein [Rhizomicrobium sp.]
MPLKLYAFPPSPRGFKALFAAHQFGIPYEFHLIDLAKGDQKTPTFLALNPNGRMPVLDDDGFVLWESNAIVEYLGFKAHVLPADAKDRLALTKWLYWESNHWDPTCAVYVFERLVKPFFGIGEPSEAEVAKAETTFHRLAGVLNGELEKHRYVTCDTLTIADLAIASSLCVAERVNYPLENYRAIQRWHADLKALPAWAQTAAMGQLPAA